jgi:hypothetical protein
VVIRGNIVRYDPAREYDIQILEADIYSEKLIITIENEDIKAGRVDFSFQNKINFNAMLEVREDDTIRCVLIPSSGYLENPIMGTMFDMIIRDTREEYRIMIDNVIFQIDHDNSRLLDYNLDYIVPTLKVEDDYKRVSGSLDTLPLGAKLIALVDGEGEKSSTFEFHTKIFDMETPYRINYINLYIESKYGWSKHLREYDIKKLSFNL